MGFEMQAVTSSNIEKVAHDAATSRLRVQFKGGKIYEYEDVSFETYSDFIASDSPGSFFARVIRNGGHAYARANVDEIDEDETDGEAEDDADETEPDEGEEEAGDGVD